MGGAQSRILVFQILWVNIYPNYSEYKIIGTIVGNAMDGVYHKYTKHHKEYDFKSCMHNNFNAFQHHNQFNKSPI